MDLPTGGVAGMIFKPAVRPELGKLSLDGQMLSVLMNLDGIKNSRPGGPEGWNQFGGHSLGDNKTD